MQPIARKPSDSITHAQTPRLPLPQVTEAPATLSLDDQILAQLRNIIDPDFGEDIVACGFVKNLVADEASGQVGEAGAPAGTMHQLRHGSHALAGLALARSGHLSTGQDSMRARSSRARRVAYSHMWHAAGHTVACDVACDAQQGIR